MRKALLFLFFVSGVVALIYEVLWFRELRLVFGSTAETAAVVVSIFFLSLSLGAYVWGRVVRVFSNPLRLYALLEFGVAMSGLLYFFVLDFYFAYYPQFADFFGAKIIFAFGILFLPPFFMGGTLPVMGVYDGSRRGIVQFYAVNVFGAVLGALMGGIILPRLLGFTYSYIFAMALSFVIGVVVFFLSRGFAVRRNDEVEIKVEKWPFLLLVLIFFSGFLTLMLEVLWTHALTLVFPGDILTFSLVLAFFLLGLALGGFLSRSLLARSWDPNAVLWYLLVGSGVAIVVTAHLFNFWTQHFSGGYFTGLVTSVVIIVFMPSAIAGVIFPLVLKFWVGDGFTHGLGTWAAVNTLGGVLGSLTAGFFFVSYFGVWTSVLFAAVVYLAIAVFVAPKKLVFRTVPILVAVIFMILPPISEVRLDAVFDEELLQLYRGSNGTVAAIRSHPPFYPPLLDDLSLRLNNTYTLGGLGSRPDEERQTHLAFLLHPEAKSVFYLGMGTGITAGASLYYPVERVVVTENVHQIVEAARDHFPSTTNNLFHDTRVNIIMEDGRNALFTQSERYDIIIGDLFSPWVRGVGDLYTIEHFDLVESRLSEDGVFIQWLPLYQMTEEDFGIVARTFIDVFDQVTLWRGNFSGVRPIVALVGQKSELRMPSDFVKNVPESISGSVLRDFLFATKGGPLEIFEADSIDVYDEIVPKLRDKIPYTFYIGNLTHGRNLFDAYPLHTDDRPVFEYSPSAFQYEERSFLGDRLLALYSSLRANDDPYIVDISQEKRNYIEAGYKYFSYFSKGDKNDLRSYTTLLDVEL